MMCFSECSDRRCHTTIPPTHSQRLQCQSNVIGYLSTNKITTIGSLYDCSLSSSRKIGFASVSFALLLPPASSVTKPSTLLHSTYHTHDIVCTLPYYCTLASVSSHRSHFTRPRSFFFFSSKHARTSSSQPQ